MRMRKARPLTDTAICVFKLFVGTRCEIDSNTRVVISSQNRFHGSTHISLVPNKVEFSQRVSIPGLGGDSHPFRFGLKDTVFIVKPFLKFNTCLIRLTTDAPLMTSSEIWFLRAEAALRGWTDEDEESCYRNGEDTVFIVKPFLKFNTCLIRLDSRNSHRQPHTQGIGKLNPRRISAVQHPIDTELERRYVQRIYARCQTIERRFS